MHLYFLLPLCSSYVLNDDNDDIIYIYICVCVCVCNTPSSFQIDPTSNAFWPSFVAFASNILFLFFLSYFEDFVRHLMQQTKSSNFLEKEKKTKNPSKKSTHYFIHTRLKRALIGWLPQSYTSLSSSSSSSFVASRGGTKRCGITRRRRRRRRKR